MSEENIAHLLVEEKLRAEKKKLLFSRPVHRTPPCSSFGCTGSTRLVGAGQIIRHKNSSFGPQKGVKPLPTVYTETQEERRERVEEALQKLSRRAPVPSRDEGPVTGLSSKRNFVLTNAVEAILKVPPENPANRELNYLRKEDYGKIPNYLSAVKAQVAQEQQLVSRYLNQRQYKEAEAAAEAVGRLEELPSEERDQLVRALKLKWEKVNNEYQKITHLSNLDTVGKIRRKEYLERSLQEIENDIKQLDRQQKIVVRMD